MGSKEPNFESKASPCRSCARAIPTTWSVTDAKSGEHMLMGACATCSLVQQMDLPSEAALHIYYAHHYRRDYKSTDQPRLKHVQRAGLTALERLDRMAAVNVFGQGQRLVDIGAGGGEFCFMAQLKGFDVQGIEPNHGYSEFAREHYGIEVTTAGVADIPAQSADVVTMFHVLEHLAHPQQVAEKVWHILRPGGLWVIEVPNILQADASPHNIYFKAHLFYYSRHSLHAATSRFFEVRHLQDDGNLFAVLARRTEPLDQMLWPRRRPAACTPTTGGQGLVAIPHGGWWLAKTRTARSSTAAGAANSEDPGARAPAKHARQPKSAVAKTLSAKKGPGWRQVPCRSGECAFRLGLRR